MQMQVTPKTDFWYLTFLMYYKPILLFFFATMWELLMQDRIFSSKAEITQSSQNKPLDVNIRLGIIQFFHL